MLTTETLLVRKKNSTLEPFDLEKIAGAIKKALLNVGCTAEEAEADSWKVASDVEREVAGRNVNEIDREDIHDAVQLALIGYNKQAAIAYITYRTNRRANHGSLDTLVTAVRDITSEISRDNANVGNSPAAKMSQIASEANKHYTLNYILPKDIAKAHLDAYIHIHRQLWPSIAI